MLKISVVIPLYNKEMHIEHTIRTILAQTYREFELIVVDDGSTDRSAEIVSGIRDERIRLIRKENGGESSARNTGVRMAEGDYVAFIDADDEWLPGFLERIAGLIEKYPEAGLFATGYMIHEKDDSVFCLSYPGLPSEGEAGLIDNYFVSSFTFTPVCASAVCVSKKAFEDLGGFALAVRNGADLDLWCRMALRYPVAYVNKPLAVYRRDSENMASRSLTTPSCFPFLTSYDPKENRMIREPETIEQYILEKQLKAVSVSLFVIRNRTLAKKILKDVRYSRWNKKKYAAFKLLCALPQGVNDVLYKAKIFLKRVRNR